MVDYQQPYLHLLATLGKMLEELEKAIQKPVPRPEWNLDETECRVLVRDCHRRKHQVAKVYPSLTTAGPSLTVQVEFQVRKADGPAYNAALQALVQAARAVK
jgi:hypothetical protein